MRRLLQVLPSLRDRHDEFLLRELIRRWENHRIMNKWMQKFFMYLDRYYVKHHSLPTLEEAGRPAILPALALLPPAHRFYESIA